MSGRILGIGGVFLKVADMAATKKWYADVLNIKEETAGYGIIFKSDRDKERSKEGFADPYGVFSFFSVDTTYFKPGTKDFMVNFRVENIDDLIAHIKEQGVDVEGPVSEEGCGTFAWLVDPNGLKIELWQAD